MALAIPIISTFDGGGVSKAISEFRNLEGAGKKAQFAIKKAAVPAAAALAGLAVVLGDAVSGAIEDAAAQDLLANSLKKTTGANDDQIASVEDWITEQGKLLGFSDDKLRPAFGRLAKATGSVTEAQNLAKQAMDIATATGKPLETVVGALEKAYGGNLTALQKLAPEYRQMIEDGASFEDVMYALAQTTGGAAAEAAETTAGKFARLKLGFDETKESIGAALLPAVEKLLPYLQKFASWAQDNPQTFMIIAGALAAIAASIVAINIAMALNPIGLIVIGVGLLIAGLAIAYTKFEGFRKIVDGVFGAIKWWITNVVIPQFNLMLTVFKTIFNGIASVWNNTIGKFSFTVPSWVPGIGGKGFSMPDIPMLAAGGIVTGPTLAMIGEGRGPEAVIPLDRMGEFGMGGGTTVNINVNGGDPQAVVQALRTYMRQNGSIPIRVSNIF
jgi:phage-related protein